MDTLRGHFGSSEFSEDSVDFDLGDEESIRDLPPAAIGQDERRMQVRAYNHWASMLGERNFPAVEELEPQNLHDFGPYSVLLDFSMGIEDPAVQYLGDKLAAECDAEGAINRLSDVPSRSLLSRITDHYMQILANQAPIGFEAEFVNQRDVTILYRGILLPFSSDNETIDFIYGVINWKEVADAAEADELLLEIDQALDPEEADEADESAPDQASVASPLAGWSDDTIAPFEAARDITANDDFDLPLPAFGSYSAEDEYEDEEPEEEDEANYSFASLTDHVDLPAGKSKALDLDELGALMEHDDTDWQFAGDEDPFAGMAQPAADVFEPLDPLSLHQEFGTDTGDHGAQSEGPSVPLGPDPVEAGPDDEDFDLSDFSTLPQDAGLYDYLASARDLAMAARQSEDRSHSALYAAIGRAFDVSLAAQAAPEEYAELLAENGLVAQDRAPMTPVVKLVFGADHDKTRLTEYAAALGHAHRLGLGQGQLAGYLHKAEGGLKGVVSAERKQRREEAGKQARPAEAVRDALADKLRRIEPVDFSAISGSGGEFALVMIRRTATGEVLVLGEVGEDIALIERAARKLVG